MSRRVRGGPVRVARRVRGGVGGAFTEATRRLRREPRRALLAALGVFAAAAMLGAAVTVSYGLATGYDRAASRADVPDVIARFDAQPLAKIRARVEALPDLAAVSYRQEIDHVPLAAGGHTTRSGGLELLGVGGGGAGGAAAGGGPAGAAAGGGPAGAAAGGAGAGGGRRGYAVVAGHDLPAHGLAVLVERGLARSWGLHVGDRVRVGRLGSLPIAGIVVEPDDVAYPLASVAHVYVSLQALEARFSTTFAPRANIAQLWLRDRSRTPVVLAQARATSAGVAGLSFVTRSGIEVLIDQAGGIVIALLVAVSLVALVAAAAMLAASWRAEVQRRLPSIGVRRALGFSRAHVVALHGFEAALIAVPAAAVGLAVGAGIASGPSARLLEALNELSPGVALLWPLLAAWAAIVVLVAAAAIWPSWRAAGRDPVGLLRGGDVAARRPAGARAARRAAVAGAAGGGRAASGVAGTAGGRSAGGLTGTAGGRTADGLAGSGDGRAADGLADEDAAGSGAGGMGGTPRDDRFSQAVDRGIARVAAAGSAAGGSLVALGARLVAARRARLVATVVVLGVSAGFVLLLLSLGSLLSRLEHDPASVGKRYQLTVSLRATALPQVERVPGVAAAAPQLTVQGADSFQLGETVKLIAYPGSHTRFEDPPLANGRRERSDREAEVGQGLAQALGLSVGSTLAVALPTGGEARWEVVGIVRALDDSGRVAYVRPGRLLAAGVPPASTIAVRLKPGASKSHVARRLQALPGATVSNAVGGATTSSAPFLGAIADVVRAIAIIDVVVCFFALAQALALAARERASTVALLRALGAGRASVARLFLGAALVLVVPAVILGVLVERVILGPAVARLAAHYADLSLRATGGQMLLVAAALLVLALLAAGWAARRAEREPIPDALREAT